MISPTLLNAARIKLGLDIPQIEAIPGHAIQRWDATMMPTTLKLSSRPRGELEYPVTLITVHVTDVRGGFGLARYQIDEWGRRLERGEVSRALLEQARANMTVMTDAAELALLDRYHHDAYHWIGSRQLGVVHNYPLRLRTSHGDGGNAGVGWALDCHHAERLTPRLRDVGVVSLRECVLDVLDHPQSSGRAVVVPHRAYSAARRVDPDSIVWGEVVIPVVTTMRAQGYDVEIGYEIAAGGGRPVPRSWDPSALFDDKGRRL